MSAQYPTIMPSEPKGVTWGLNKLLHCVFERICPFVIQNVTKVETEFVIVLGVYVSYSLYMYYIIEGARIKRAISFLGLWYFLSFRFWNILLDVFGYLNYVIL